MRPKRLFGKFYNFLRFVILIVLIYSIFILLNSFFSVRHILVQKNNLNKKIALNGLSVLQRQNILILSTDRVRKEIIERNPWVRNTTVSKLLPDTLQVKIDLYNPFAYLKSNEGYFLLSDDARILAKQKFLSNLLPVISYYQQFDYQSLSSGEFLRQKDILTTLSFLEKLKEMNIQINSIDIGSSHMLVFNSDGKIIIFTTEKSQERQRYELEIIVRQTKIDGKDFKSLDLRFDKPVIIF